MLKDVPDYIKNALKGEPVDFIVQSAHDYVKRSIGLTMLIGLGMFFPILISSLLFLLPLIEMLITGSTQITVNGIPETYTRANPWGAIMFAVFPTLFFLIFIIPIFFALKKALKFLRKKGSWYAGTNNYLIEFNDQSIDHYKWSEFENSFHTKMNKDSMDIILTLKKTITDNSTGTETIGNTVQDIKITLNNQAMNLPKIQKHILFMNKIGLLGIENGGLVLNMIKHNMERYKEIY